MTAALDLNADLGEGFGVWTLGDDDALLAVVTSANVACGFHAGDASTMRAVCAAAAGRGVAVGAQVSYRDLAGFGRRFIDVDPAQLADEVLYQIGALEACARAAGTRVSHVKPHGALYNATVHHEAQAAAVVDGVRAFADLPILGLPGSRLLRAAGDSGVPEAFADRGYTPRATLVPRTEAGAVLHDPDRIAERVVRMALEGVVEAVDGSLVAVDPESICVHGDTPGALAIAERVRAALEDAGIDVRSFL